MAEKKLYGKVRGAIYGLAVADALGVPYEFMDRGSFEATGMTGFGTHLQKPGTWSDDTSMTLATCASIKETGWIDSVDIRKRFEDWLFNAKYTVDNYVFDCGIATGEALRTGKGKTDVRSNGNGSLMRMIPLAFVECDFDMISDVSAITHGHIISRVGCNIYVYVAKRLLAGYEMRDIVKELVCERPYDRLHMLEELEEDQIKSSGYVVDTLEAALWCLLKTDNYRDAVLKAVNLGDDTDTVAAVTGGLAGIMYGYESIPEEWIETLRGKDIIEECLF